MNKNLPPDAPISGSKLFYANLIFVTKILRFPKNFCTVQDTQMHMKTQKLQRLRIGKLFGKGSSEKNINTKNIVGIYMFFYIESISSRKNSYLSSCKNLEAHIV